MADVPPHCGIVTVCDAHPATLGWLGAIHGHRTRALGVEHFGQTGSIPELYRHYGIDANAIVAARGGDRAGAADPLSQGAAVGPHASLSKAEPACLRPRFATTEQCFTQIRRPRGQQQMTAQTMIAQTITASR